MKIIDLHCDTMSKILAAEDVELAYNNLEVDIKKLKEANSLAQFFSLFIDLKEQVERGNNPFDYCHKMLDKFYQELEKNKEDIALARNYEELRLNQEEGKISAFLTIEEGGVLQGELYNLRNFYRLGVRLITLVWHYPNGIGYPDSQTSYMARGLTPFGKKVVKEMNRLGMLVDVSHLSEQGFYDVANISSAPFIASHSNAREIKSHPRNLTDKMIKTIAESGGVVGVNFVPRFLGNKKQGRIEDIVKHILYLKEVGGIEVVTLGSDFDGFNGKAEVKNIGEMDKLIAALEKVGLTDDEIEKICYKNVQRVLKEVL